MDEKMMEFEANFSVLDRYGTDITKDEYITNPAIGRDEQIRQLILILLTPEKSAILIGKPGIGKTAIVEGLAYRLQNNDVPDALKGYSIVNIKTASLLGTMPSGESKVQKMIDELKTKEKLILFIDEIHMLIGATDSSSLDFANIFKEGLGRGSIKVIGATTTEEYERYILRDKAFTRRFQKVEVPEPTREETIKIMMGTLPKFEKQTGRKMKYTPFIQERIMSFLVDITSEYKRVYALGSRYPDVCLTLLKQAFSYTVYDNRPYMDIFDVRKAVENTKNVYPDVIKKELPNFDKMFNDIILEEKGEKPVEEWRKDNTLTRAEQEGKIISTEPVADESALERLATAPNFIDRIVERDNRPVKSIISNKSIVGSTAVSQGLKEKINRTKDAKKLDDMLLSGELEVIKGNEPKPFEMPTKYTVTEEIKPGVSDNILLGKPIQSTIEDVGGQFDPIGTYNSSRGHRKGGNMMQDNRQRPVRQDISTQNFDKYANFFSQDSGISNNDPAASNNPANDFLPANRQMNNNQNNMNYQNNNGYPMNQNMNGPMNNQYGMGQQQGGYNNMPPQNNGYYPNNQMGPGGMPQNGMNQMPPQGNRNMPMNGPMNNQYGMGPQRNQQMPPMGQQGNRNMPNNMPNNNMSNQGGRFLNDKKEEDVGENLFGAPMYDRPKEEKSIYDSIPDIYGPMDTSRQQKPRQNNSFLDIPMNNNQQQDTYEGEKLFGAPMYSNNPQQTNNNDNGGGEVDIFGQLITDNMRIKNGKIVDEFPTFDKIDNLSSIKSVISDVRDVQNNNNGLMDPPSYSGAMDNGMNSGMDNNKFINNDMSNYSDPTSNSGMMNNSGYDNSYNTPQPSSGRSWTFIDDTQPEEEQQPQDMGGFQNDILEIAKKEENTIATSANTAVPTSNKDYYEDMKSGEFVNLNDLNSGKIKEEESNKYMGIPSSENKPQFDLNLEGNGEEDEGFDDFYE